MMEIALYEPIDDSVAARVRQSLAGVREPVTVAINSGGGDITSGFAIYNALRAHKGRTVARIDGIAASMATIVALGAKVVSMADNAWFMIHNPWGVAVGESGDLKRQAGVMDQMKNSMISAYAQKSGLPEDEIAAMMDAETWLTASEAKERGFVDEIYPAEGQMLGLAGGCFAMLGKFHNTPADLLIQKAIPAAELDALFAKRYPTDTLTQADIDTLRIQCQAGKITASDAGTAMSFFTDYKSLSAETLAPIKQQFFSGQMNLEQVRGEILNKLAEGTESLSGLYTYVHAGNGNLVGDSVKASIEARLGRKAAEQDNRYNGYSLKELARASLQDRSVSVYGMNTMQMVGMAFTHSTSDFSFILADVANKSMLSGWENSPETYPLWTKAGSLPDFKTGHRVGTENFPRLKEVREGAEYKYATTSDRGERIVLATYGALFSITRQAIINDDLTVLSSIPEKMGRAARATVGDLVYAVLFSNPELGDGLPLFSDEHGNLITGALSTNIISDAKAIMRRQTSADGQTLNIIPKHLIVPAVQESLALQVIRSTSVPGMESNSGVYNPLKDAMDIIVEPRLDANSEDAWYVAAAQGNDTIEVAYLDGTDAPYLESTNGFTVDGTTYKVRIDAGVAPLDWRGIIKSTGVDSQAA
ncbi:ClpP-like prohead protease/major capsid protein fusion protein [Enterobacter ludwigii]